MLWDVGRNGCYCDLGAHPRMTKKWSISTIPANRYLTCQYPGDPVCG